MNPEITRSLRELLKAPQDILLIPHKNPDGDAIGSCLGLMHYLRDSGHKANILSPNDFPAFLKWMPGASEIQFFDKNPEAGQQLIAGANLVFTLDFNSLERCGDIGQELEATQVPIVMVDHHQSPDGYARLTYSDPAMSSTCEMVYNLIGALSPDTKFSADIATCLYTGILTDTGSFKFSATTPDTMRAAARLMESGADHGNIHRQVYDTNRPERLRLLGRALQNLKILPEYQCAYISLTQDDLDACGFRKGDTEGFVNYGLSLEGVVLAAIFIESRDEGIIKISLRSLGDFSVNDMARSHFEGGGHINAAGGRSTESLEVCTRRFEQLLPEYKEQLSRVYA